MVWARMRDVERQRRLVQLTPLDADACRLPAQRMTSVRAGDQLESKQRNVLEDAKDELRAAFGRD